MPTLCVHILMLSLASSSDQVTWHVQPHHDCAGHFDKVLKMNIYEKPNVQPEFPGGFSELLKFLGKELHLTNEEWEDIGKYILFTILIDKEGKAHLEKISKHAIGVGQIKSKAERLFRKMPSWKPGRCNGKAVAVRRNVSIRS